MVHLEHSPNSLLSFLPLTSYFSLFISHSSEGRSLFTSCSMSTYPPSPLSPSLRRRQSFSQHSPQSLQDQSLHSPNPTLLSPSIYVTTPRGSQFINVPIVARGEEGEERRNTLRVPLTPSAAVIDQMARFGPRAQDEILEGIGMQEMAASDGGKKERERSWKEKFKIWMISQGASAAFSTVGSRVELMKQQIAQVQNGFGLEFGL